MWPLEEYRRFTDQNTIKNIEMLHNKGGMDAKGLLRPRSHVLELIWARAIKEWLRNDHNPLELKHMWAPHRNQTKKPLFLYKAKMLLNMKFHEKWGGSDHCSGENIWAIGSSAGRSNG